MYEFAAQPKPSSALDRGNGRDFRRKLNVGGLWAGLGPDGTVIAKRRLRTRRVDKGKSGQARKTAVSGSFGGGILSQSYKQALTLFGGTE